MNQDSQYDTRDARASRVVRGIYELDTQENKLLPDVWDGPTREVTLTLRVVLPDVVFESLRAMEPIALAWALADGPEVLDAA